MKLSHVVATVLLCAAITDAQEHKDVNVAVLGLFHPQQMAVEASSQPLLARSGKYQCVIAPGPIHRMVVRKVGQVLKVQCDSAAWRTRELHVTTTQHDSGPIMLAVPGRFRREYEGQVTLTAADGEIAAVVSMELETAVASIVAAEMPATTPLEALKAQAVVTRSYLVAAGPRHANADFCDTTHCQFLKAPPPASAPASIAARATAGIVLTWNGKPFGAMFSASCGGRTHSLQEIGYPTRDYPYYAVACRYCQRSPDQWSRALPPERLPAGNERERILAGRKHGWDAVPSDSFHEHTNENGSTVLVGVGHGHGVGLCQRGAAAMAREGKNFREILGYYFPNTTLR